MPKPSHKDFSCILNMLESIQKILDYSGKFENADDLYNDTKSFDATMMNFVIIGEMVEKLSSNFIAETENKIDWFKIKSLRNIVAHNYFGIDAEEVWQIIKNHLSDFKKKLERTVE
ncbi:MAG: nucleotidyltransferase [Bacteroidota bacterium]|nr:nucleotidyltransferase [Bacteroidota bacterium]